MNDLQKERQRKTLPKWAQAEMAQMEMRLGEAKREAAGLRQMIGSKDAGGPFGISYGLREDTLWLPKDKTIISARRDEFTLDVRARDPHALGFEIMVTSHHGMVLRPQASNVVHVEPGR